MAVVSPARFREDSLDVGALGAEAEQRGQQQKRGLCCPCLGTRRRREGHGDRRQWPGKAGEDLGQPMLEVRRRGEGPDSPAGVQLLVEQPLRGYGSLAVVEDARPQQVPDVGGENDAAKRFKDARWSLLKRPEKLTGKQAATLARIRAAGGEVWRAYTLKEAVRGIFEPGLSLEDVTILIDRLLSRLARSRLEPFVRLGKTIRKHRDGILAAIRLGINQGRTEALNNKVRLITRRAYGFHSAKAALALITLTCGPITLHLPHELHALGLASH